MSTKVLLLFDEEMAHHDPGRGHPEKPERLRTLGRLFEARLNGAKASSGFDLRRPSKATRQFVEAIHSSAYLDRLDELRYRSAVLDGDTATSAGSVDAAYLAAGAAIEAVEAVVSRTHRRAFAAVRPPGHHAEHDHAMGFCLLNNIAIAADYACRHKGMSRVLIVDWDVHHGNGTQHAFYTRKDVLVFNTHLFPFYPGTGSLDEVGRDPGAGHTVNVPMPSGMGDGDYVHAFREILWPIAEQFKPELVLVSAGFDAHHADPLGGMELTESGFAALCAQCCQIADRYADGRLAMILEGGYDLAALEASVAACLDVLEGAIPDDAPGPSPRGRLAIERARDFHRRYWP
jgi:acetoin utilization deacetylase AcuC-like enzyme